MSSTLPDAPALTTRADAPLAASPTAHDVGRPARRWRQIFRDSIALRLFFTVWLVYSVHFASDVARETYLALSLGERLSIRVDEYVGSAGDGSRVALAAATRASIRPACGPYISNIVSELRTEFLTLTSAENSTVPPSAA